MKYFTVQYSSKGNVFSGNGILAAETLAEAQTMFFEWLKKQSSYSHLYRLEFEFKEYKTLKD